MLVIAARPVPTGLDWSGRRHDDDGPGATRGAGVGELFDAVFHALHDGEQVAVGFPAPLSEPVSDGEPPHEGGDRAGEALAAAERDRPGVRDLAALLHELGRWRPWTVVSTSLPRWRATTSVLVWETASGDPDAAVEAFFALAGSDHGAEDRHATVRNLAAAAAVRAELTVDESQLREPVVLVRTGG